MPITKRLKKPSPKKARKRSIRRMSDSSSFGDRDPIWEDMQEALSWEVADEEKQI